MQRVLSVLLVAAAGFLPAARNNDAALIALRDARDFFALRDSLAADHGPQSPTRLWLAAETRAAFSDPAGADQLIDRALAFKGIGDSLRIHLLSRRMYDYIHEGRYAPAARDAATLEAMPAAIRDTTLIPGVHNEISLLRAVADVPPQQVTQRGETTLAPADKKDALQGFALTIGGVEARYFFDTGANYSVLMRSEAVRLGLTIRPAGLQVRGATGALVNSDVAVGDHVRIGGFELQHVIFLVFPDSALTFPGGFHIPGIIGFPVLAALGELRFHRDGSITVPEAPPERTEHNLAFDGLDPIVRLYWGNESLVGRLDTGADFTVMYEPFSRRFEPWVDSAGAKSSMKIGGAGGVREVASRKLPEIALRLGSTTTTLRNVHVYTEPVAEKADNYLLFNLGRDFLGSTEEYVINFRSMAVLLH